VPAPLDVPRHPLLCDPAAGSSSGASAAVTIASRVSSRWRATAAPSTVLLPTFPV